VKPGPLKSDVSVPVAVSVAVAVAVASLAVGADALDAGGRFEVAAGGGEVVRPGALDRGVSSPSSFVWPAESPSMATSAPGDGVAVLVGDGHADGLAGDDALVGDVEVDGVGALDGEVRRFGFLTHPDRRLVGLVAVSGDGDVVPGVHRYLDGRLAVGERRHRAHTPTLTLAFATAWGGEKWSSLTVTWRSRES